MSYDKKLIVGIFGYGVVGQALYQVLTHTPSLNSTVKKICIKNRGKQRNLSQSWFTTDRNLILDDPEINVVIEVTDDAKASFEIASTCLSKGKAVITANKKMVAARLEELIALQKKYNTPLLYESACCASIPIIRNLEEYYDNDLLRGFEGIINGSTNFILSKMHQDRFTYREALQEAQEKGFAESDPSLDVEGHDAANKLVILLAHAYGVLTQPRELLYAGIKNITPFDIAYAESRRCHIKLVAQAIKLDDGSIIAFLLPRFVQEGQLLHQVREEYNGLAITSALADQQFFYGKGAGGFPTASAILSDLSALRYDYRYEYKKLLLQEKGVLHEDVALNVYISYENWEQLPIQVFIKEEEYFSSHSRHYRKGVVSLRKLLESDWWKKPGVSLILCEDCIAEQKKNTHHLREKLAELAAA
jgi:homoserine dehydrogenase